MTIILIPPADQELIEAIDYYKVKVPVFNIVCPWWAEYSYYMHCPSAQKSDILPGKSRLIEIPLNDEKIDSIYPKDWSADEWRQIRAAFVEIKNQIDSFLNRHEL